MEQDSQKEKELMLKKIKSLENNIEELSSNLTLKERELQYKDALFSQAIKQPLIQNSEATSTLNINRTASLLHQQEELTSVSLPPVKQNHPLQENEPATLAAAGVSSAPSSSENKGVVGGIWARLNSN